MIYKMFLRVSVRCWGEYGRKEFYKNQEITMPIEVKVKVKVKVFQ
jgi:hypothetical protein